jgi:hypothetical protein
MSTVTVTADAGTSEICAIVLSSLPVSYAPTDDLAPAQLITIDGGGAWPTAVDDALGVAGRAAIVVHPVPADLTLSAARTTAAASVVVIDSIWAGNAAVPIAAQHIAAAAPNAQLVECRVISGPGRSLASSLTDAAALVRALLAPISEIRLLHHDDHGFVASALCAGLAVSLSVTISTAVAPHAYVRVLTDDGGVEITLPHPATARPSEIVITDPDGSRTLPTIWESSHRSAWRRARALLDAGTAAPDLVEFVEDQSTLSSAIDVLTPA